jgi:hypothetical protein
MRERLCSDYLSDMEKELLVRSKDMTRPFPFLINVTSDFNNLCLGKKIWGKTLSKDIIKYGFPSEALNEIRKEIFKSLIENGYSLYEIAFAFERKQSTILRWFMNFDDLLISIEKYPEYCELNKVLEYKSSRKIHKKYGDYDKSIKILTNINNQIRKKKNEKR